MQRLEGKNLAKTYNKRAVVTDVSIELGQEIVGILGPNGAGKTTTFYMMLGLTSPTQGTVTLGGTDITHLPLHQRARLGLGYLPQEQSIFQNLSVADNILAILELNRSIDKKQRAERLDQLLEEFHISHLYKTPGISLSGGERRRVEIARTLANDPTFILLDEPFAGIDPLSVIDIKSIVTHLHKKGIGILITDHNVRETLDICERAYIFNEGKVIAQGSTQEILANQTVKDVYLGEQFQI